VATIQRTKMLTIKILKHKPLIQTMPILSNKQNTKSNKNQVEKEVRSFVCSESADENIHKKVSEFSFNFHNSEK